MNKETRKSLIGMYLDAELDIERERELAEWFAVHGPEPGEESAANLILAEYPEAGYESAEKEFDSVMASRERRTRVMRWACGIAACAVMAVSLGLFLSRRNSCQFNGLEIAQGIERIMSLDMENVESITACPKGSKVIFTAVMNDGSKCSYMMSKDGGSSAISIVAMNDQ